ncbi:MAG: hypothetical protein ABI165_22000 [Bryobacteraceae bacterium]
MNCVFRISRKTERDAPFALCVFLVSAAALAAQPTIAPDGIFNAASNLYSELPNGGIAQGSIFVIYGSNLGPAALAQAPSLPLGTQLAGTSVNVTMGSTTVSPLMVFTLADHLAAVLPSTTPAGTGTVTVTYNGQTSAAAPIRVVANAFGISTLGQTGGGPGVLTDAVTYQVNTLFASATPGEIMTLWGTGLGAIHGDDASGPVETDLHLNVQVYVGNQPAAVSYSGRSSSPGLDQINFAVPAGLSGCYVPVAAVVNGVVSNFVSMSIAPQGGICSDPMSLPAPSMAKLAAGGTLNVGSLWLTRISTDFNISLLGAVTLVQDYGDGYFYQYNQATLDAQRSPVALAPFSACTVYVCNGFGCIPTALPQPVNRLDGGAALSVTGPKGTKPIARTNTGEYHNTTLGGGVAAVLNPAATFLDPGAYTLTGPGGSDIGAFTSNLTIPQPLQLSNKSQFTNIPRTSDLTVTWTGGGPNDYVAVVGQSTTQSPQVTATFACSEKASAGKLTIPAWVLSALPASGTISQSGFTVPGGFLELGYYPPPTAFSAQGLDLGFSNDVVLTGTSVTFQ